jgi:membrane protein DedA with SNARE-associated domain
MEKWHYGCAAVIGFLIGFAAFLLRTWLGESSGENSKVLIELAATALVGTTLACAVTIIQRWIAQRSAKRHDWTRQIRISRTPDG